MNVNHIHYVLIQSFRRRVTILCVNIRREGWANEDWPAGPGSPWSWVGRWENWWPPGSSEQSQTTGSKKTGWASRHDAEKGNKRRQRRVITPFISCPDIISYIVTRSIFYFFSTSSLHAGPHFSCASVVSHRHVGLFVHIAFLNQGEFSCTSQKQVGWTRIYAEGVSMTPCPLIPLTS